MTRSPRYRTGDPELDRAILDLVTLANATEDENSDLVAEMLAAAVLMAKDRASRGDLKIAAAALREMRLSFRIFDPYREERKVSIFGSARTETEDPLYDQTRRFAAAMAAFDWMVITGAGPGIMSAGIEGAGPENSFGVGIRLPFESATSEFIAGDPKLLEFRYFFTRKLAFMKESHGFALLPGGFGTLDEAFELLTLIQTGKSPIAPIVLLDVPGGTYWASWIDFIRGELVERGYVLPADLSLVKVTDDVAEAVEEITSFYSTYHSQRFVGRRLILRLVRSPSGDEIDSLNTTFGDILTEGRIESIAATPAEIADDDHVDLPRLALHFDRAQWAELRQLINALNQGMPQKRHERSSAT